MPLSPGDKLGPHEILGPLGAGGMGEVYRARDTKLHRDVAIKVLPAALANDAQYMARFEREAQMLAALNHPNIATVYGIEQGALVMELVEGAELKGPLPLEEALAIARQIAAGLEAAHERGITHRDLKPANIKLTPAGVVKILDFGLAKVAQASSPVSGDPASPTLSPTLSLEMTRAGMILGTAAYMSPEQARGRPVDKRTDIWAFGVVLYEILTGKRLFEGEDLTETMASVVKERPDLSGVPANVRRLLERCLEKDPQKRLRDIGDMDLLLADAPAPAPSKPATPARSPWIAAAALLMALGVVSFLHFRETPAAREVVRFEIPAPASATFITSSSPVVSPDGRKVAFLATGADRKPMVWVRSLDSEQARPLTGTEDASRNLFWSPDSRSLAFGSGGKLKKIEAAGGPAQTLCDAATDGGGVWTSDNRILYGTLGPLQLVSAAGGTPTPLTTLDRSRNELAHGGPSMLPDGHHFLYLRFSIPFENSGLFIGSLDAKPDRQSATKLLPGFTSAVYVPSPLTGDAPGFLLFLRGLTMVSDSGTLMAQPFDPKRMEFAGDAVPLAEQVSSFSASPNGVLAFKTAGPGNRQLTWYDRKGSVLSTAGEAGDYSSLALSPDGTRVAYARTSDLWLFEFARGGVPAKFTFGNFAEGPTWSADGSRIVFVSIRGSGIGIYQKASNLAGQEELLYQSPDLKGLPNWTHDGKFLMYTALGSDGKGGLWILPAAGSATDRKPLPFLRTGFDETFGRFSPDGRWVAYQSNQSGKNEVYVLPFDAANPGSPSAAGLHQVSKDGGTFPRWSQNGKELVYLAPDGNLMSVEVRVTGSAFQTGTAQPLFKLPAASPWDVSADGQRFLIAAPASSGAAPASAPYHVVMNWTGLLKR
ncbi:Serine/threonine protein kinase [Candidatus Sulfopaludibacter sp. SbA4]|nr:Serine/threonine protein kinase [Candidatus Sulfopaludibacter sp. SbA4]